MNEINWHYLPELPEQKEDKHIVYVYAACEQWKDVREVAYWLEDKVFRYSVNYYTTEDVIPYAWMYIPDKPPVL